jgi:hypothetical protein
MNLMCCLVLNDTLFRFTGVRSYICEASVSLAMVDCRDVNNQANQAELALYSRWLALIG